MVYTLELEYKHHFDAAHKLNDYKGVCGNRHGHRWEVVVRAKLNTYILDGDGVTIDFNKLKAEIDLFDHKDLNTLGEFSVSSPSAENISMILHDKIKKMIEEECEKNDNMALVDLTVQVFESPNASVKVRKVVL